MMTRLTHDLYKLKFSYKDKNEINHCYYQLMKILTDQQQY